MRMVLVVDAQNIFHCPKKNVDQMKAKFEKEMYGIGHLFVKTNEYRANLLEFMFAPEEDQKSQNLSEATSKKKPYKSSCISC